MRTKISRWMTPSLIAMSFSGVPVISSVVCKRGIADCASQCDEAARYSKFTGSNQYGFNGCANNVTDNTGG